MSEYKSVREQVMGNGYTLINDRIRQAERRLTVEAANLVWLRVHNTVISTTPNLSNLRNSVINELELWDE